MEILDKPLFNTTESQAIDLLGSGIMQAQVASALGVTESAISQLFAREEFKQAVAAKRYESLQRHNQRDDRLNSLEDRVIDKIESALDLVYKPLELVGILRVVNGAKRRGLSAPEALPQQQRVVSLALPKAIQQKFILNVANQVVQSGEQSLVTLQSMNMDSLAGVNGATNGTQPKGIRENRTSIRLGPPAESANSTGQTESKLNFIESPAAAKELSARRVQERISAANLGLS